jgi:hypothetical protein
MVNRSRVKSGGKSVWDHPRPPQRARRVLESSHPPVYYVPLEDYGGWITAGILGPFKGGPCTWGW